MLQVTPHWVPSHKAAARFGSRSHSLLRAPGKWGKKKEKIQVLYVNWNSLRRGSLADVSVISSMVLAGALAGLAMRERETLASG